MRPSRPALVVRGLTVTYGRPGAELTAVHGVDLDVAAGGAIALLGPSGSGKSSVGLAIGGQSGGRVEASRLEVDGVDVRGLGREAWRSLRGLRVAHVFQDPGAALDPLVRVGDQLAEAVAAHGAPPRSARAARVEEALRRVGLGVELGRRFPHELSGGQKQRVVLAAAMVHRPALLVADEPSSALDPDARLALVHLLAALRAEGPTALLLITHDESFAAALTDGAVRLSAGRVVGHGPAAGPARPPVPPRPAHPAPPLLEARGLGVVLEAGHGFARRPVAVLHGVDVTVRLGQTLGLVGPSGSGKSTLGRALLRLVEPAEGTLRWRGADLRALAGEALRRWRRHAQPVFQDALAALGPRCTVGEALGLALDAHGLCRSPRARAERLALLLDEVGLPRGYLARLPHELSGGERQRVALARALAVEPELLVCDEVTASLDGVARDGVVELLRGLQARRGLALVWISHDHGLVAELAHDVLTLRDGRVWPPPPARHEA